jgi:hypothetical protein
MKQNVARGDRALRAVAGGGMLVACVLAPLPLVVRLVALGGAGVYMLPTAVFGSARLQAAWDLDLPPRQFPGSKH